MMQWFVDDTCRRDDARIPIGYPLPGNRLALVDEEGRATPPGEVGELIVASPYVSLGRWVEGRLADESVETGGGRGCRMFRTGDLVRQRPDGLLERVGRKDRQVKIRGSRVDLDGVEAMLRGHPFVRDVAALARPSSADGTMTLVAYVSARDGAPAGLIDELKALMRSAPPPMRPARFYLAPRFRGCRARSWTFARSLRWMRPTFSANVPNRSTKPRSRRSPAAIASRRRWLASGNTCCSCRFAQPEDDFFDSGGDSLKAITFVIELERALGLELSLTLINEAPRFDQLCQALRERRAPGSTPLVTLKAGDGLPPVFFIHGVGGNVVEILPTARRMTYPGAVIGIRARGVVRGEAPHTSIEAMAADYLREIKKRQPNGPYYLCGYSSGGLVAFEIARRLSESGDEVGLVGLFDTTMSPVRWPLRAWLSIVARRMARLAAALRAAQSAPGPPHCASQPSNFARGVGTLRAAPSIAIRVAASALIASAKYQPGFYRGELTLFSPAGREPGLPSLESVWRKHARTVVVVETPGTHVTMLSTRHAETTAACVTRCLPAGALLLAQAQAREPPRPRRARLVLIATDCWDQTNGITTLYRSVIRSLDEQFRGHCRLLIVHPTDHASDQSIGDGHRVIGMAPLFRFRLPQYPELITGYVRHKDFRNLESVYGNVDVVHIATQGLLGLSAMRYATRYRKACVGFYHTNWPAYINEYLPSLIPSRLKVRPRTAVGSNDLRTMRRSHRAYAQDRTMPQQRPEAEPSVHLGVCRCSAVCDGRCDALKRSGCRAGCVRVRWQNRQREASLPHPESCRHDQAAWLPVDDCWRWTRASASRAGERRFRRLQTRRRSRRDVPGHTLSVDTDTQRYARPGPAGGRGMRNSSRRLARDAGGRSHIALRIWRRRRRFRRRACFNAFTTWRDRISSGRCGLAQRRWPPIMTFQLGRRSWSKRGSMLTVSRRVAMATAAQPRISRFFTQTSAPLRANTNVPIRSSVKTSVAVESNVDAIWSPIRQ